MTTKSKPWIKLNGTTYICERCGGISIWKPNVKISSNKIGEEDKVLTFFRWMRKFKQHHAKCISTRRI